MMMARSFPYKAVLIAILLSGIAYSCSCPCSESGAEDGLGTPAYPCELQSIGLEHDSASLGPESLPLIEANAACILRVGRNVILTGHTDPRGVAEYNLARGERMAKAVKSALVKAGVTAEMIRTRSMGEERPLCRQATEECRRMCRRVEAVFE